MTKKKDDKQTRYILCYGSLRHGEYNFKRINSMFPNSLKFITSITLTGYRMYNLGGYPAAIYDGDNTVAIICDVMQITKEAEEVVEEMETGAGYSTFTHRIYFQDPLTRFEVDTKALIYLMIDEAADLVKEVCDEIYSGDWVDYCKKLAKPLDEQNEQ